MTTCKIAFGTRVDEDREGTCRFLFVESVFLDGRLVEDKTEQDEVLRTSGLEPKPDGCEIFVFSDNPEVFGAVASPIRIGAQDIPVDFVLSHFDDDDPEGGEFEVEFRLPRRVTFAQLRQHETDAPCPRDSTRVEVTLRNGKGTATRVLEGDVIATDESLLSLSSDDAFGSDLVTETHLTEGAVHAIRKILILN